MKGIRRVLIPVFSLRVVRYISLCPRSNALHSHAMSGIVAIVGRPNVGKSALFNRIVGRRVAIVHDQPGVTRDRVSAEAEWRGRPFMLVDTGGIGLLRREKSEDVITQAAYDQVQIAIESADVIILVVNVQEGIVPLDREVAARLRKAAKQVLVAVNKVDSPQAEAGVVDFAALGFEKMFPVSAIHGEGMLPLMDAATAWLPADEPGRPDDAEGEEAKEDAAFKIAIVGRPNVGKSSLINALTQSSRVIVSPVPGTTRDAIDVPFEVETEGVRQRYLLIDTAGVRKYRRIADSVELFSVMRTEESVKRCDLVVFVLDAEAGITEQEKKIGDLIVENRKACVVVINKWDLVEEAVRKAREEEIARRLTKAGGRGPKVMTTLGEFGEWVHQHLFFLDYAPVIFTSAQSGFHLDRLLEAIRFVAAQLKQKIPTALLNRTLHDAVERRQPVSAQGLRLKFFYATQVRESPPTFLMFVNRAALFSDRYKKYVAGELRRAFGYEGCPLILVPKERPKTIEPVRSATRRRNPKAQNQSKGHGGHRKPERSRKRHP